MSNTAIKPEQVTTSIALAVASFYGLYSEVSETIDDGYTPYEALYEWDIVDEELITDVIKDAEECHRQYLEDLAHDIDYCELPF